METSNKAMEYILCLYIFLFPLIPENLKYKNVSYGDLILAVYISLYILELICSHEKVVDLRKYLKDFFSDYLSISMMALLFLMLISTNYSLEKSTSLKETLRFLSYLLLFFIIKYNVKCKNAYKKIICSFVAINLCLTIFGTYQAITGLDMSKKFIGLDYSRITSTLGNPNNYAAYLTLSFFPILLLAINQKKVIYKVILYITSILMLTNIILTFSRNAYIGLFIGFVLLIIIYSKKIVILLGSILAIAFSQQQIRNRISDIVNVGQNESRIKLWKIALKMIKDHPLLGVGNGNYISYYDAYVKKYPQYSVTGYTRYSVHNTYLKILSELGIFGIAFFILFLLFSLIKVKQIINKLNDGNIKVFILGFYVSMFSFYFMNLVDNLFFAPKTTMIFWLLLGLSQSVAYNFKKNESLHKQEVNL